jgi:hypothetical protein
MNIIKKIMISSVLFLGSEQIIFSSVKEEIQKRIQQKKAAEQASPKAQQARPAASTGHEKAQPQVGHEKSSEKSAPSEKVASHSISQELIKKFTDSVDAIAEKPTAPKADEKGATSESSKKDYEEKKKSYYDKIEKAFAAYKELFEESKKSGATVTQSENDEIKKAAKKLFERKNIQNMVWHCNIAASSKETAKSNAGETKQ